MSKLLVLTFSLAVITAVMAAPKPTEPTKYEKIDENEIINNEELLKGYYKCLMDEGPCTPEGAELKKDVPDALQNDCSKCSQKDKEGFKKVFNFMIEKKPEMWSLIEKKYDPTGIYRSKYNKHAQ